MSKDSTKSTIELPNGVRLTWDSNSGLVEFSTSQGTLGYVIDQVRRGCISIDLIPHTDGIISCDSKTGGLEYPYAPISTGGLSGLI